mmetsp:Transcript_1990/g.2583  ORF Transcript_1990/g.2583 Transcript_1990/m.2583 type:complete len:214 (+) Transcript_1990:161-802(+)
MQDSTSNQQAGVGELKDALVEILEQRGVVNQIKARLRAEIFSALESDATPPQNSLPENVIINELIREYLEFNKYLCTNSVFLKESGHPAEKPFDRAFLSNHIGVDDTGNRQEIPLLYGIVDFISKLKASETPLISSTNEQNQGTVDRDLNSKSATGNFSSEGHLGSSSTIGQQGENIPNIKESNDSTGEEAWQHPFHDSQKQEGTTFIKFTKC